MTRGTEFSMNSSKILALDDKLHYHDHKIPHWTQCNPNHSNFASSRLICAIGLSVWRLSFHLSLRLPTDVSFCDFQKKELLTCSVVA
jgi:hypothetical protein